MVLLCTPQTPRVVDNYLREETVTYAFKKPGFRLLLQQISIDWVKIRGDLITVKFTHNA